MDPLHQIVTNDSRFSTEKRSLHFCKFLTPYHHPDFTKVTQTPFTLFFLQISRTYSSSGYPYKPANIVPHLYASQQAHNTQINPTTQSPQTKTPSNQTPRMHSRSQLSRTTVRQRHWRTAPKGNVPVTLSVQRPRHSRGSGGGQARWRRDWPRRVAREQVRARARCQRTVALLSSSSPGSGVCTWRGAAFGRDSYLERAGGPAARHPRHGEMPRGTPGKVADTSDSRSLARGCPVSVPRLEDRGALPQLPSTSGFQDRGRHRACSFVLRRAGHATGSGNFQWIATCWSRAVLYRRSAVAKCVHRGDQLFDGSERYGAPWFGLLDTCSIDVLVYLHGV